MRRISTVLFLLVGSLMGVASGCGGGDEGIDKKPTDKADAGEDDESSNGDDGSSSTSALSTSSASGGGTSGTAASAASSSASGASTSTSAASTSEDTGPFGTVIGVSCEEDADCVAPTKCIRTHESFDGALPGTGVCTMPCESSTDCSAVDSFSYCDYVGSATQEAIENVAEGELPVGLGYMCMQGCFYGQPDETKCGGLSTFACYPLDDVVRADSTGEFEYMIGGCTPLCHADSDCQDGEACDIFWGVCVESAREGKAIGELCNVDAVESECASEMCLSIADELSMGICTAFCNFHPDATVCGGEIDDNASAGCVGSLSTPIASSVGDRGQCIPLCDDDADCPTGLACSLDEPELTQQYYGRSGFCFPTDESIAEALEESSGTDAGSPNAAEVDAGDGG
jgi:hypothetical protein